MSNFLPNELIRTLSKDPHFNTKAFVEVHENEQKISSARINPSKIQDPNAILDILEPTPWCPEGFFLKERPVYTLDPLFHAGCYYSQEASSMFLDYALRSLQLHEKDISILDLCAAPGGKSTLINSAITKNSLLVSNEIIKTRVPILQENLSKWGNQNTIISNNDPSAFGRLPGFFDALVVDAPCSGSGMFRKDNNAISEWSEANVKLCAERQRRILASSISSLKTNGYLFYSTCSYSKEENEDIVDWLIDEFEMESVKINIQDNWGIDISTSARHQAHTFRFYPHLVKGEGFFLAILKKKEEQVTFNIKKIKQEKSNTPSQEIDKWIDSTDLFSFIHKDYIHVFPKKQELALKAIQQVLYLKNAGTVIGKWTGKEIIPSHDLALSSIVLENTPSLEVNLETALQFLRKDNIPASVNTTGKTGWILMRYKGVNIGWIKALPNRINNYYPKEIRIANL